MCPAGKYGADMELQAESDCTSVNNRNTVSIEQLTLTHPMTSFFR